MSLVTDLILLVNHPDEDEVAAVERFKDWIREEHNMHSQNQPLKQLECDDAPGGNKCTGTQIWIGGINYCLDDAALAEALKEAGFDETWDKPCLLVKRENEEGYEVVYGEYVPYDESKRHRAGIGEYIWSPKAKEYRQKMFYKHCIEQAIGKAQIGSVAVHIGTSTIDPIELVSYYKEVCDEEG